MGTTLIDWDHGMIMDHIRSMKKKDLKPMDMMRYLILRADIDISEGRTQTAEKRLDEAMDLSDMIRDGEDLMELVSRVYNLRAEIFRLEGRNKDVIKAHLDNVRRLEKEGSGPALGKAMNNLALAYKNAGQVQKAEVHLRKASRIFEDNEEDVSRAFVEANLSEICLLKNDLEGADHHLSIVERTRMRSPRMESRLRRKTGRLKMMMKEWKGAYRDLGRSYHLSIDSGNRKEASGILLDMMEVSIKTLKKKETMRNSELFLRFLDDPTNVLDRDQVWRYVDLLLSTTLATDQIMERVIGYLGRTSDSKTLVKDIGTRKNSIPLLKASVKNLKEEPKIIISLWLAEEYIQKKKKKEALKLLRKVRKEASTMSFRKAVLKADDLMNSI
jgi:tetratricopeptide (TPR) repeat protein